MLQNHKVFDFCRSGFYLNLCLLLLPFFGNKKKKKKNDFESYKLNALMHNKLRRSIAAFVSFLNGEREMKRTNKRQQKLKKKRVCLPFREKNSIVIEMLMGELKSSSPNLIVIIVEV
jgi:hypothetical protein